MMTVEAIQGNDRRRSIFVPMAKGAAIGAAAGLAMKYTYPVTQDEKNSDEYIKVSKKVNAQKTEYNIRTQKYVDSLRTKLQTSLAEDEFVKMFDGMKEGEKVKPSSIRNAIKNIKKNNPDELLEFRRVCKDSSDIANKTAKQFMNAYDLVTKHIRPTGFFLITGAIVGAFIALIKDVVKTDVKN